MGCGFAEEGCGFAEVGLSLFRWGCGFVQVGVWVRSVGGGSFR